MRQGMDRGKGGTERRGTSRVSKSDTSRRAVPAASGRPASGRMNVQAPGTSRAEAAQQRGQAPAPPADNTPMLYVGIGGGALVFALILAVTMSGGGGESGASCAKRARRCASRASTSRA